MSWSSIGLPALTSDAGPAAVPYSPGMPIYRLGDLVPRIHPEAYVHPEAVVIGDVTVGSESTVWPGAVLRGDYGTITIGERSSVQDGTVIHAGPGFPTWSVTDASSATWPTWRVAPWRMSHWSARARSSCTSPWWGPEPPSGPTRWCPTGWRCRPGALAIGVPAKIRPDASNLVMIQLSAQEYVANGHRYRESLERLG